MAFDAQTLGTIAVIMVVTLGILLLVTSLQGFEAAMLRWWGLSYILGAIGLCLIFSSPSRAATLYREGGNALCLVAYGCGVTGCRAFARRPVSWLWIFGGAVVWLGLCWIFSISFHERIGWISALIAAYAFRFGYELRPLSRTALVSQRIAFYLCLGHGLFYVLRIPLGPNFRPGRPWMESLHGFWAALNNAESLIFSCLLAFLLIGMMRDRASHVHRRAALEDVLTGIGNRRALIESGQALFERSRAKGAPTAVILFDIDHFKDVNDTHGHDSGDRILIDFVEQAATLLPEAALFCRAGGEEFVALLPETDLAAATEVAETIRAAFAEATSELRSGPVASTVSAGVAVAGAGDAIIADILARADVNLYRAKAAGRNRVNAGDESRG